METAIRAVRHAHLKITAVLSALETDREVVAHDFARIQRVSGHDVRKGMLALDHAAETACRNEFEQEFKDDVHFVGEETLASFSGWTRRYCVLVDMIDGTDVLEMGLNLWCSAIIIFDHAEHKLIGAVIGLPSGHVLYAQEGEDGANIRIGTRDFTVSGCSGVASLSEARICFYGQKIDRMFAVADNQALRQRFATLDGRAKDVFRIYNFAGNPMLAKLVNRPKDSQNIVLTGDVDAVFELAGQQIHDMAAGAYIAAKAGAFMCDFEGQEITFADLAILLETPRSRKSYVIASTKELALDLTGLLGGKPFDPGPTI